MSNFFDVTSPDHLKDLLSADLNRVSLLSFWAEWAEPCEKMNQVVKELAVKYPNILVLSVEAESQADISESFDIEAVPSFVMLRGHTLLTRISGADAAALASALATHSKPTTKSQILSSTDKAPAAPPATFNEKAPVPGTETPEQLTTRLRGLMNQSKVVLFMKGVPDAPECGFSRQTVALLRQRNVQFSYFNIYTDESVRQGLKVLNEWPTFPQLIVDGNFVGGLDIIKDMIENEEFDDVVGLTA